MKILAIHFGDTESLIYLEKCIRRFASEGHHVTVLCSAKIEDFWVEQLNLTVIKTAIDAGFFERWKLRKELAALKFDVLIDVQRDFYKPAYQLATSLSIATKVGYNFSGKTKPYTRAIEKIKLPHIYSYYVHGWKTLFKSADVSADLPCESDENLSIAFVLNKSDVEAKWQSPFWVALATHPTFAVFKKGVVDSENMLTAEEKSRLEKAPSLQFVGEEKLGEFGMIVTLKNAAYLAALFKQKRVLLLDERSKERKFRRAHVTGSYTVTPRFEKETIEDIQFDAVLKALRDMVFEEIE